MDAAIDAERLNAYEYSNGAFLARGTVHLRRRGNFSGCFSLGNTLWVTTITTGATDTAYDFNNGALERNPDRDIVLAGRGAFSHGDTAWVLSRGFLRGYDYHGGRLVENTTKDISLPSGLILGGFTQGESFWIINTTTDNAEAYDITQNTPTASCYASAESLTEAGESFLDGNFNRKVVLVEYPGSGSVPDTFENGFWARAKSLPPDARTAIGGTLGDLDFVRKDGGVWKARGLNDILDYSSLVDFTSQVADNQYPSSFADWAKSLPVIYTNADDIHRINPGGSAGQIIYVPGNQAILDDGNPSNSMHLLDRNVPDDATVPYLQSASQRIHYFTINSYGDASSSRRPSTLFIRTSNGLFASYTRVFSHRTVYDPSDDSASPTITNHYNYVLRHSPVLDKRVNLIYSDASDDEDFGRGSILFNEDKIYKVTGDWFVGSGGSRINYWILEEQDAVIATLTTAVVQFTGLRNNDGLIDDINLPGAVSLNFRDELYTLSGTNKNTDMELLEGGLEAASPTIRKAITPDRIGEFIRVYRYSTRRDAYVLVGDLDNTRHFFRDYLPAGYDEDLPVLATQDYLEPPRGVSNHIFTGQGRYLVCERNRVYISPVGINHAFIQDVVFPCGEIYGFIDTGQSIIVITDNRPFAMVITEDNVAIEPIDVPYPCVSAGSIVDMGQFGLYASHEGLIVVGSGSLGVITGQIFTERQWKTMNPHKIDAIRFNDWYLARTVLDDNSDLCFLFNPASGYFTFVDSFVSPYFRIDDGNVYVGQARRQ